MQFETHRFSSVRNRTVSLTEPLWVEDFVVQSMPDASPTKWHLAHTTWFFETFVLKPYLPSYRTPNDAYEVLFNSYYNGVGEQAQRDRRGTLSRPGVDDVMAWRRQVDDAVAELIAQNDPEIDRLVTIGIHHEEQHQELLVTDIKHALVTNPVFERYHGDIPTSVTAAARWIELAEEVVEVGHRGDAFCFDNESPRHKTWVPSVKICDRVTTNDEYLAFIDDGGYRRHELWLSDAWSWLRANEVESPLYWLKIDDEWFEQTMAGVRPLEADAPVTHISFFEADAFARWSEARLPTEFEWERFSDQSHANANFLDDGILQPISIRDPKATVQGLMGGAWEWTASAYRPYPGYQTEPGALGEYNGKFMNGQFVLRGGSCATPRDHIRATYRNFFGPEKRWQFTGIRLAKDVE